MRTFRWIVLLAFCATVLGQGRDELRFRNGSVISGQSITHDDNTVVFRGPDGIKTYPRSDVSMIVFGGAPSSGGLPPGLSAGPGLQIKRWYTWRRILDNPRDG